VRVLAVDTSTARESVALAEGGRIRGEVRLDAVDSHSIRLMPAVAFLLQGLALLPTDVDGYAVAAGPGSFTGLRVGIGTVQGLALAADRPCAPISALDALAVAVMEAHRGEVFGGTYDVQGRPREEPVTAPLQKLLERVPDGAAFIGDGVLRYRSTIAAARPAAVFPRRSLFLAGTVALMGEAILSAGGGRPASELRPLYLREASTRKTGE